MARQIKVEIIGDSSSLERAFGRASNAGSRLGGLMRVGVAGAAVAVGGAFAALGAAAKVGFDEFNQGQEASAQTAAAIKSTGGAANVTAKHVDALSSSLLNLSGVDDEAIKGAENMLLTFTSVRNEAGKGNAIFDRATKAVLDMDEAMTHGNSTAESLSHTSILVGKALNDPIRGATALRRVGVSLTEQQQEQIKAFVKSGDTMKAQKLILGELTREFGGTAKAVGDTFSGQLSKLRETLNNVLGDLVGRAMPAVTAFAGVLVNQALPQVESFAASLGQRLAPTFQQIGDTAQRVWPAVQQTISTVWAFIGSSVIPVVQQLGSVFLGAVQSIAGVVQSHMPQIRAILDNVGTVIRNVASVAMPLLRVAFAVVLPAALRVAIPVLELVTGVIAKISGVVRAVAGAVESSGAAMSHAFGALSNAISGAVGDVVGVLNRLIASTRRIFGDVVGAVRSAASTAGAAALHVGAAIVSGIVSGLGGLASELARHLVGPVMDAYNGLKHALGIRSPSRLFAEQIGAPIAQGIMSGYASSIRGFDAALVSSLSSAASAGRIGLDQPRSRASGSGLVTGGVLAAGGQPQTVVHVHVTGSVISEDELGLTVLKQLQRYQARSGNRSILTGK